VQKNTVSLVMKRIDTVRRSVVSRGDGCDENINCM